MKTKEELTERYDELYQIMATSKDPDKMQVFGETEKWVFHDIAKRDLEYAESWLSHLEAICWNNYLSEKEATNISKNIVNQDGSKGFHWAFDTFAATVNAVGGVIQESPYYNSYALWAVANMIYSDHAKSIALDMGFKTPQEVSAEKMAISCYRKAIEKLKDPDRKCFVRNYFKEQMYG